MSFSRAFQWYHSHLDPIWPDGTFKTKLAEFLLLFTQHQPPTQKKRAYVSLKGLSHEIDFKNFDKNLQNLT